MFAPPTPFEIESLALSLKVALVALLFALPIGAAIALLLARATFPGKWLVEAAVTLPLVLPPVVTGLALLLLFGARGPVGRSLASIGIELPFHWTGAALAAGIMALPLIVRPVRQGLESVDRRLEQAAADLGASRLRILFGVTLPLALPGLMAAALLGFARAFGEFGATMTFAGSIPGETQTLPLAIYAALQGAQGDGPALRLAVLSILVSVGAVFLAERLAQALRPHGTGSDQKVQV